MKSLKRLNKIELRREILTRGVDKAVDKKHLEEALTSSKKLRIKLGIDATAPDLHLGNAVVLHKLRQFQELGHKIVLIIGDFTTKVGDPSGQSNKRKMLSDKEIKQNMKNYSVQAGKIINIKKAEVRYNSEWLGKSVAGLLELAKAGTINQVSERADFRARMERGQGVTFLEAFYALLQGYDSVNIKADVEIGGSDQLLNLLMGRQVQRYYGMKEQDILTVPLLEGTDGRKKMSKSYNNYIGLDDSPKEMFGKAMSIGDGLIIKYLILCTDTPMSEVKETERSLKRGVNPKEAKLMLAHKLVSIYHNKKAADQAKKEFVKVFSKGGVPAKVASKSLPKESYKLVDLLVAVGLAGSKSEAKRLVTQGGVRIDGTKQFNADGKVTLSSKAKLLQVGRRKFLKIKAK